jgi:hypothetical protein
MNFGKKTQEELDEGGCYYENRSLWLTRGARVDGIVLITAVGHCPVQYRNMFRHSSVGM